jgi:hypothetical protein
MKKIIYLLVLSTALFSCNNNSDEKNSLKSENTSKESVVDTADLTNNFYDNVETYQLNTTEVEIAGEISNPAKVDFSTLEKHSIIVKEALLDSAGNNKFIGAYRYDGYSLMDILNNSVLAKKNLEEFAPIIDLYVEIENAKGEKVVFTWGEIYYPNNLHRIIIATNVARIVPSKTNELWDLPTDCKIVSGNDLLTERNISNPTKITVKSYPKSFPTEKGMSPMYSPDFNIFDADEVLKPNPYFSRNFKISNYEAIFYGRGRGIHSTTPFTGIMLKDLLSDYFEFNSQNLKTGLFCAVAKDGYRVVFSFSEIFNRNDQQEILVCKSEIEEDGGLFRIFPACDFFSDRAVKSLVEIHFTE